MESSTLGGNSILGLFKQLARESKIFVREEVQLAKTELSEKLSSKAKSGTKIVVGGFVAYAGLIVFLIGPVMPWTSGRNGTVKRLISQRLIVTTAKRPKNVPTRLIHHQRRREGSKKTARSDIGLSVDENRRNPCSLPT